MITTEEKGALDDWYVRNASLWLDLRIACYRLFEPTLAAEQEGYGGHQSTWARRVLPGPCSERKPGWRLTARGTYFARFSPLGDGRFMVAARLQRIDLLQDGFVDLHKPGMSVFGGKTNVTRAYTRS